MARIVLGSYVVQFPLGGYLSWVLQWLVGLRGLGHEVAFVEKSASQNSCYDPEADEMTHDCAYGVAALEQLLQRSHLGDRWCFVDFGGRYHGLGPGRIEEILRSADLFIDMGTHGAWLEEASSCGLRVLIDGEPGATQMKMAKRLELGENPAAYDRYFSVGQNIGTAASSAPTAGVRWEHVFYPVDCNLFACDGPSPDAPFTTVMSWSAHDVVAYDGRAYGAKDREFEKFVDLPKRTRVPVELAIAGRNVPRERLLAAGFRLRDAHAVSLTYDAFRAYIQQSRGEFSVAKEVFVATNSGWFGDRAAAYLACGRPVVMQETGFSAHLPCGEGLFAVRTAGEAADAISEISGSYDRHSSAARTIALEHLDTRQVLRRFLRQLGISA